MDLSIKDKKEALELIYRAIKKEIEEFKRSIEFAQNTANEAPGAMQSQHDTLKSESQRLAGDLQTKLISLERELREIKNLDLNSKDIVSVGSLIRLEDTTNGQSFHYFILPGGHGIEVKGRKDKITAISSDSPLGSAVMGKSSNEIVAVKIGQNLKKYKIINIY